MSLQTILGENGNSVKMGDKVYQITPLTLGDIAEAEEKFGCDLESFDSAMKKLKNVIFLIFLSIRRKQPTATVQEIGDLFLPSDMGELQKIMPIIMSTSGLVATTQKNE